MFEDQYRKAYDKAAPSEELQQETLELMQEARAHRIQKETPPAPRRLRYIPAVATAAAALFVGCVLLGFWLNQGDEIMEDAVGNIDDWSDFADSDNAFSESQNKNDGAASDEDYFEPTDEDAMKNDAANSADGASNSSGTEQDKSMESDPENENSDDASADNSSASKDPITDSDTNDEKEDSTPVSKEEYASLLAFTEALNQKTAPGYGKNYYNARELLIVPSLLPDNAVFQGLELDGTDGTYSYSYFFTANETTYLLTVEIKTAAPKSLSALDEKLNAVKEETVRLTKADYIRTYLFGEDCAEVRLTPLLGNILPDEATVDLLLSQFQLERCSKTNPLLGLTS